MAFPWGFNFRATLAYVTDPAGTVFIGCSGVLTEHYPTSKSVNGDTVDCGWDTDLSAADRDDTTATKKLSGIGYAQPTATHVFRVDLPSTGTYRVRLALGDAQGAQGPMQARIFDDATLRGTVDGTTGGALSWFDATDVERTSVAAWVSDNAYLEITMATTIFNLELGGAAIGGYSAIAHLEIDQVAGGGGGLLLLGRGMDDMGAMS